MIIVGWQGKVVTDNKRLIKGKQGRLVPNSKYIAFKEGLAWEIKAQTKHQRYKAIDLLIYFELHSKVDKQNLLKPICDAIELAGVVVNDKCIGAIRLMPTDASEDKMDHIMLFITGCGMKP